MSRRTARPLIISFLAGLLMVLLLTVGPVQAAQQQEIAITSREIVERLARLEEGLKRIEQRMDSLEKRIDDLNRRIDDVQRFMLWGFGITLTGIFGLMGFVIWDRRTAINPATRRIERIEEVLRRLSKDNPELAESLRNLGIL